ncbi:DUF4173 domain-containing protein [Paenibacillus sp. TRM 82003]|nr:DUF4173 domain-containing protein [Paenibacillus sp. TRM 82003]
MLLGAFALSGVHQYFFFGHSLGVQTALFTALLYGYAFVFAKERFQNMTAYGWFVLAAVGLLSLTYVFFDNPLFRALNFFAVPLLALYHLGLVMTDRKLDWADVRWIGATLYHTLPGNLREWPGALRALRIGAGARLQEKQRYVLNRVLIGLMIAAPVLFIVVNLLASADGVFNRALSGIPDWLGELSIGEGVQRLLWIAGFGLYFFGLLRGLLRREETAPDAGADPEQADAVKRRAQADSFLSFDPIVTATVLIAVNVVYVLFVAVQFTYLFGAWEGMLPEGSTYAEYARRGFNELVAVSVINFGILVATLAFGDRRPGALLRFNRFMLYLIVGCSAVMLYSAYSRLVLYEEAYGYTYIRFLVHAFMLYLGVLMLLAAVRVRKGAFPLARAYVIVSLVAYVAINYVGMDRWIAAKNIERYHAGHEIDANYLGGLSADAVPVLIRFREEAYPELLPYLHSKQLELESGDPGWQAFNLARHRALGLLREALE